MARLQRIYEFGPFRLDRLDRHLWRDGQPVHMTPKIFDLLVCLVESEGKVLAKDEIIKLVWRDRHVDEANLTQSVSVLRKVLGESESGTKYIATYPGKGYQFLVEIRQTSPSLDPPAQPAPSALPANVPKRRVPAWVAAAVAASVIVSAGVWLTISRVEATSGQPSRRTPISRLPGGEYQPVFSPNGTKVAFVWDRDGAGSPSIYTRVLDEDEPKAITDGKFAYSSPAWSPDGRHIAAYRHESGALKLVVLNERDGGSERVVTTLFPSRYGLTCRHLDWAPNGKTLVVDDKEEAQQPLRLYLVDADSGRKTKLTESEPSIIGDVDPRFSADGSTISFVRMWSRLHNELFTVRADGSEPPVRRTNERRRIAGHDWSSDGRWLHWSSDRNGDFRIWKQPAANASSQPVAAFAAVSGPNPLQFSLSRANAGRIVYSDFFRDLNIWKFDVKDKKWNKVIASTGEDTMPQVSPDGRKLCFHSDRSGTGELWVSSIDGKSPAQLTRGGRQPVMGRWSADSKTIVYNELLSRNVMTVDVAGGWTRGAGDKESMAGIHPVFAVPSGIYYTKEQELILESGNHGPQSIAPGIGFYKVVSQDGKSVYHADRTSSSVTRLDLSTRQQTKVVTDLSAGHWGAWTIGATGLYYLRATSANGAEIARKPSAGGPPEPLAVFPAPLPPLGTSSWSLSPDGRSLFVVKADNTQSDLMLIEQP